MADWKIIQGALSNVDPNDRPRKLTEEEIRWVMSAVPSSRSNNPNVVSYVNRNFNEEIRKQISQMEIPASQINKFRIILTNRCVGAIEAGGSSSIVSSNVIVSRMTQSSLSSFHQSGSRGTSASFAGGIVSIFSANTPPDERVMNIHFMNKNLTRGQILFYARRWITVRMKDIIEKHVISRPAMNLYGVDKTKWWFVTNDVYWKTRVANECRFNEDQRNGYQIPFLRIFINKQRVFNLGITLDDILSKLRANSIHVLSGSLADGFIDIIVDSSLSQMTTKPEFFEMNYLVKYVLNGIKNILISGYYSKRQNDEPKEYIKDVEVITNPLSSFIDVVKNGDQWTLSIKPGTEESTLGIPISIVQREDVKLQITSVISSTDNSITITSDQDVGKHIATLPTNVGYNSVLTIGSAYASVMRLRIVDSRHSITSDVKAMNEVLGIEYTRKFMAKSIDAVVGPGSISFAHALVIIDIVTRTGSPKSFSITTITSDRIGGVISWATARSALLTLIKSSISNESESTRSVTPAVLTAMKSGVGTSYNNVVLRHKDGKHKVKLGDSYVDVKIHSDIIAPPVRDFNLLIDNIPNSSDISELTKIEETRISIVRSTAPKFEVTCGPKSSAISDIVDPQFPQRGLHQKLANLVV